MDREKPRPGGHQGRDWAATLQLAAMIDRRRADGVSLPLVWLTLTLCSWVMVVFAAALAYAALR